jgi:hypothetical protein
MLKREGEAQKKKLLAAVPPGVCIFLAALFAELTHFFQINAEGRGRRTERETLRCVHNYLLKMEGAACADVFLRPLSCGAELKTLRLLNK